MSAAVGSKPVEILIDPVPHGAGFLMGDALRLGQVMINLASNAIKFTDRGEVFVKITKTAELDSNNQIKIRFAVKDTGIGIDTQKLQGIFNAFAQADTSTTRTFGGTGLGLTISRRLVEMMGGTLQVESTPGQGSEFSFELPFELSEPVDTAIPEMKFQRILIADDQPTAREVIESTVRGLGWTVDVAENGRQAMEMFVQNHPVNPYDIVLFDWRMPEMDGLTALNKIKEMNLPVPPMMVMITAHDRSELIENDTQGIVDVVAHKPVTSSVIYNAVLEAKSRHGKLNISHVTDAKKDENRLKDFSILVVDDNEINRDVAERILIDEGASIMQAVDGEDALLILQTSEKPFDIVLMDVQMPVMDGYTATARIRKNPDLCHLPVIALTAGAMKSQREQALAAGMNGYISKPFNVDELVEMVLTLTSGSGDTSMFVEPSLADEADELTADPGDFDPLLQPDFKDGIEIWNDEKSLQKYLAKFVNEYSNWLDDIFEMDAEPASRHVHKIKGTAGSLGLKNLSIICGRAEQLLSQQLDARQELQDAQLCLKTAIAAISEYLPKIDMEPAEALQAFDVEQVQGMLENLRVALNDDDLDEAEVLLSQLNDSLGKQRTEPIRNAIDNFDVGEALQATQGLQQSLMA